MSDDGIPQSAELLVCFDRGDAGDGVMTGIACRLRWHHDEQWQAEDQSRDAADDDEVLAKIKRHIDTMNLTRSRLVDELDAWLTECLSQNLSAPLHTETLGSVVDRLSIAWVRADRLGRREDGGSRSQHAARQLEELAHAYDVLVSEIRAGSRRVPDWRALKSYGERS
ncbi:DUF4254 domain-containing protein [Nonomuraea guangzhouensis]|uniref:DUF4254 domain-containing protein n=1 Tax=Nonomuraea guangzhouensis TaxID=1291555 RepID=A0ABW4G4D7_9ACTN|nr:DUF4254 domain-containing protein [Nonomuraea guangzhouensis]